MYITGLINYGPPVIATSIEQTLLRGGKKKNALGPTDKLFLRQQCARAAVIIM